MNATHCFVTNYNMLGAHCETKCQSPKVSVFYLKVTSYLNGTTGMAAMISYP